ncbi:hypothetical protein E2562_004518 [Oryza meyeriana var. granulata]|uniref:Uncharacterized protein n=1 Tax=Oryza meyeriana var. granulata TaxID=110450 RepID=A0A6G1F3A6_9ORYZ|nr:hypothetical protein E2562_004518 [Oryza meyeriana var. granulata]
MDAAWTEKPSDDAHRAQLETSARLARVESHDLEVGAESSSERGRLSFFFSRLASSLLFSAGSDSVIPSPPPPLSSLQSRLSLMLPPFSPNATVVASPVFPSTSLLGTGAVGHSGEATRKARASMGAYPPPPSWAPGSRQRLGRRGRAGGGVRTRSRT